MTKIKIVSRLDSAIVLYECDAPEGLPSALHMRHALDRAVAADANLSDADISGANLLGANLLGANLLGANLWHANLSDADLSGANLSGANLSDADLSGANLLGANLLGANLWHANLSDANLSGANLLGANLWHANLSDADLSGANLSGANLSDADLSGANLLGANLLGANLWHANLSDADLSGANLSGANLSDANLSDADLSGANLSDGTFATSPSKPYQRDIRAAAERYASRAAAFRERNPDVPVIPALDAQILAAVESGGDLEMGAWHICETTHCRAGWAIHLAGEKGYALEKKHGSQIAGRMIYKASVGRVPHFFASNERALEDLREQAVLQQQP